MARQRSWVAIGDGTQHGDPPGGPRTGTAGRVPSEPTVRRVVQPRDGDALDAVLTEWLTAEEHQGGDAWALTARASAARPLATGHPVHLLAALDPPHRAGRGEVLVDTQTHEIPKRQDLWDPLDVAGRVAAVDAWPTQAAAARDLVEDKHAHGVMTAKGNPSAVHDACTALEPADCSPAGPDGGSRLRAPGNARHLHRDRAESPPQLARARPGVSRRPPRHGA